MKGYKEGRRDSLNQKSKTTEVESNLLVLLVNLVFGYTCTPGFTAIVKGLLDLGTETLLI